MVAHTDAPREGVTLSADDDGASGRDTPGMPALASVAGDARATLTVLTGPHAGRSVTIDGAPVIVGRAADADLVIDETGVSRYHARITHTPAGGFYVEDLASKNGTFIGSAPVGMAPLQGGDLLQLGHELRLRFSLVDPVEVHDDCPPGTAVRDPLTHVFSRRYFSGRLVRAMERARRAGSDVAVLVIGVDSLSVVNECFGHLAGDRALCTIAARILRTLRVEDIVARHGGDEFVVLATEIDGAEAKRLGERVRRAVEGLRMSARGHDVRITASIGIAALTDLTANDEPASALLALADARMNDAKASRATR
jgi:diguanylate cyclase (GGDEF)-like protein